MFGFIRFLKRVLIVILCSLIFTGCNEYGDSYYFIVFDAKGDDYESYDDAISIQVEVGIEIDLLTIEHNDKFQTYNSLYGDDLDYTVFHNENKIIEHEMYENKINVRGIKPGMVIIQNNKHKCLIFINVVDNKELVSSDNKKDFISLDVRW